MYGVNICISFNIIKFTSPIIKYHGMFIEQKEGTVQKLNFFEIVSFLLLHRLIAAIRFGFISLSISLLWVSKSQKRTIYTFETLYVFKFPYLSVFVYKK